MSYKFKQENKQKLRNFPSSDGKDCSPVHWRKSRQRLGYGHYIKRFFQIFAVLLIVGIGVIGGFIWKYTQNNELRAMAETKLATAVGNGITSSIKQVDVSIGGDNLLNVNANGLDLKSATTKLDLLQIKKLSLGVNPLGLLKGEVNLDSINVANVVLALPIKDKAQENNDDDAFLKKVNFETSLKAMHNEIDGFLNKLEENGFKELTLENLKITGFEQYGLNSDELFVKSLNVKKQFIIDRWSLMAEFDQDGKKWELDAVWEKNLSKTKNIQQHLKVNIKNVLLSEFLNDDFSKPDIFAIDGKAQFALNVSFNKEGEPIDGTSQLKLEPGKIQIPDEVTKTYDASILNFKILPQENKIALVSSSLHAGANQMKLVGEFDFNGKKDIANEDGTTNPQSAINFNISSQEAVADAENVDEPAIPFIIDVKGAYMPNAGLLNLSELNVDSPDGSLKGSVEFDFNGETPALKLDLKIPKMKTATFKQLWPYTVAAKARIWVLKNVSGGSIEGATFKADIPHGIVGRIPKGAIIEKQQMTVVLPIMNSNIKITDDFPIVSNVDTIVYVNGMITNLKLNTGQMVMPSKGKINLAGTTVHIDGDKAPPIPDPISIVAHVDGNIPDILKFVQAKPLSIKLPNELSPTNITGRLNGSLYLDFLLQKNIDVNGIKWRVEFDVLNFASKKPIDDVKLSSSKLQVQLNKQRAEVTGKAKINGISAVIDMVEPFAKNGKLKATRKITVLADEKVRKSLGIDLDGIVDGTVPLTVTIDGSAKSYKVNADLKNVKLSLPWVNWSKGKGIPGELNFDYSKKGKLISIDNFRLKGKNFSTSGLIRINNGTFSSAKFSKVALNAGDNVKLDVTHKGNTFDVSVVGTSYDARAVIKYLTSGAKEAKSDLKQSGGFNLTLAIAKLKGFNKEVMRNAAAKLKYSNGQLRKMDLSGSIAKASKFSISIQPKGKKMELKFSTTNAGSVFNFFDIYSKMRGGSGNATLLKSGNRGPYIGDVMLRDFVIVQEPRLKKLVSQPVKDYIGRDKSLPIDPSAVKFIKATAELEKGEGYLKVKRGLIRNDIIGSSFRGTVFNKKHQMKLVGTFMPAYGINRLFGKIPLLGVLLGNGSEGGLFGITYKLEGSATDPKLFLNPLSVVTPGIFREIFQFNDKQ